MKAIDSKRVPISEVKNWEKNPRNITDADRERLARQLKKLGQFKPLIAVQQKKEKVYTIIGGNMRLEAITLLNKQGVEGFEDVWISLVEVKDDREMLEIALADNDRAGHYDEALLVPLVKQYADFDMEDFHIDTAYTVGIDSVVNRYDMADVRARGDSGPEDVDSTEAKKDAFDQATIKQIVLYFGTAEYKKYIDKFEKYMELFGVESNTEVVMKLDEFYESNQGKKA